MSAKTDLSRRALLASAVSTFALTAVSRSAPALAAEVACIPKVTDTAGFRDLVKDSDIVDVHCHIFNATDFPAYQFLDRVVALKVRYDEFMKKRPKDDSIYDLHNYEWDAFYRNARAEFEKILAFIKKHEFLEKSYPFDRMVLTPDYEAEMALLDALHAKKDGKFTDIERTMLTSVANRAKRDSRGVSFLRHWMSYTENVDWRGPNQVSSNDIARAADRMKKQNDKLNRGAKVLQGYRNLLGSMVQSRTENYLRMREMFDVDGVTKGGAVKLFAPALVDFDYWLDGPNARGAKPDTPTLIKVAVSERPNFHHQEAFIKRERTTIRQQSEMMGSLSRLFPAECHAYFGFCPWRQVDATQQKSADAPLALLKSAIEDHGFIGVKLYPPMGFGPRYNNLVAREDAKRQGKPQIHHHMFPEHLYDRKRFPYLPAKKTGESTHEWKFRVSEHFGQLLDGAMADLYRFCIARNVPIMAHAGPTNFCGGYDSINEDGKPQHTFYSEKGSIEAWYKMLTDTNENVGALRLNLAHSGFKYKRWVEWLIKILNESPNVYADISYFDEILGGTKAEPCAGADDDGRRMRAAFEKYPTIATRIMYGSDWYMTSQESFYENYLNVFARILYEHAPPGDRRNLTFKAVMGGNACRYLGLDVKDQDSNYTRLKDFYARIGQNRGSDALAKLDRLSDLAKATAPSL